MSTIISGYNRLFVPNAGVDNNVANNNMEHLKDKALRYVKEAFKNERKEEAEFLLNSTKVGSVKANVSLMLLCEDSTKGRNLRLQITTLNGYKSYNAAADMDNFRFLCLIPDVPKVVCDDVLEKTSTKKEAVNRNTDRNARLTGLVQGTLLMTNYIDTSNAGEDKKMEAFKNELKDKKYGSVRRIWVLNGVGINTTKTCSILSLHQRVSLLRVVWNYFLNENVLPSQQWISKFGYELINGSNPQHFNHYADIADKHRLAIDKYVRTRLQNEDVRSEIKIMQTKDNTIPRQLSVCSWKNFLPRDMIENFVKNVCNGGIKYMFYNGKYIRMAKSHDFPLPSEFFLSSKRFPCDFACTGEMDLMYHVNEMFALQNPWLKEKEKEAMIELCKTKPVNFMMQTISKIGDTKCTFGEHNDWTRLLASLIGESVIMLKDDSPLPQRHLMQVLTIGFTYPIADEDEACLEFTIEWKYNGTTVGKITTTGNFAHLQLYGLNDEFFTHDPQYLFRGVIPDAVRVVITFRRIFSRDPADTIVYDAKVTEECSSKNAVNKPTPHINELYKHTNVINTLLGIDNTNKKEEEAPDDDDSNSDGGDDSGKKKEAPVVNKIPLKFPQLKPEEYKRLCLPRPKPPQAYPEPMGVSMARSEVVMKLLREEHTLVYRHYGQLQNKPALWVKKNASMYKPGEEVDMARVAAEAGILYNSHQHDFAPSDPLNDAIFMLTYQPKNDCIGLRQTYELIQKGLDGTLPEEEVHLPTIFTFGSGGNANKQGTNAPPSLHKASKGDAAVKLQSAQCVSDNECNSTALFFS